MRYELMLPHQIRKAIKENWPVGAAARRARVSRRAHGGRHGHAGGDQDARPRSRRRWTSSSCRRSTTARRATRSSRRRATARSMSRPTRLIPFAREMFTRPAADRLPQHPLLHPPPDREFRRRHADRPRLQVCGARQAIFDYLGARARRRLVGRQEDGRLLRQAGEAAPTPFNWIKGHPLMTPEIIAGLSLRPCRRGRDVADAGALP